MVQLKNAAAVLVSGAALVAAVPAPAPTPAPDANAAVAKRGSSCLFTDASAASKSKADCATITLSAITVPSGTTLDLTDLNDGTEVILEGTTTFEYEEWSGPLFSISGTDITMKGASGAVLDGNGAKWWDGEGSNGGVTKPKFFYAHDLLGTSTISGFTIQNAPVQFFSIDGSEGLTISDITVDNSAGDETDSDGDALGHNTDAFDVGDSSDITISGVTVQNQDDCLAINSGTSITFTGNTCSGGHGISIGSVGGRDDNTVKDIVVESCTVKDSQNGIRIKTVYDATGSVSGVTYKDVTLSGITDYGVVIEQDYENGSPTGTPTDGVPISDVTFSGVSGTVESDATNIYILCASCSDFSWDVDVTGGKTSSDCTGVPSGASC